MIALLTACLFFSIFFFNPCARAELHQQSARENCVRPLKETTAATATSTSLNKRLNESKNCCVENVNHDE